MVGEDVYLPGEAKDEQTNAKTAACYMQSKDSDSYFTTVRLLRDILTCLKDIAVH